ncbi:sulfotransferase 1B1-like isoform X2 [Pocillopora verrucosa]|uniref:sulfotransferase 1B1-like isoform X2 n=1 Tax=Pocillopora verrucosa TaxID=203993 RepID=UPI00333ED9D4
MSEHFTVIQEKEGEFFAPRQALIHGVRLSFYVPNIDKDFERDLSRFETRSEDIYVVSFPKSGTTWVQEIVWQILNDGKISEERVESRYSFLETSQLFDRPGDESDEQKVSVTSRPSPRLIKSHLPYHVIPKSKEERKRNSYGFWSDHVLPWWKHRDEPYVLFLKYEDLKKDLCGNVRLISEFLEKPLSDEMIRKIAHQCTFAEMKKNSNSYVISAYATKPNFLRKGQIGDWKSLFSEELNKQFEETFLTKLNGTGLHFDTE